MKKRILSCFMALALCLTLLPATAQAADTHAEQQHCLCGMSGCNGEGHGPEITLVTFNQWLGSSQTGGKLQLLVGGPNNTGGTPQDTQDNKFVLTGGNYYLKTRTAEETFLDGDVTIKYPIVIRGDVTICLNGQTIQSKGGGMPVFEVQSDATLILPSFMLKVPDDTDTPPPFFAVFLLTLDAPPFMVKVPPLTYTPPPPLVAVLSVMVPPYMLNLLFPPYTYTPPP